MKKFFAVSMVVLALLTVSFPRPVEAANGDNKCDPKATSLLDIDKICNPNPDFYFSLGHDNDTFAGLLTYIIQQLLGLIGLLSLLFIIIGGYKYVTSAGNEEQAESGKKTLTNAIIGLAIVIMSYVIIVVVVNVFKP